MLTPRSRSPEKHGLASGNRVTGQERRSPTRESSGLVLCLVGLDALRRLSLCCQAAPELLGSSKPPASASQAAGTPGALGCARLPLAFNPWFQTALACCPGACGSASSQKRAVAGRGLVSGTNLGVSDRHRVRGRAQGSSRALGRLLLGETSARPTQLARKPTPSPSTPASPSPWVS